jgi:cytochrome c-type biogenesis protein CcmH/NrfG
MWAARRLVLLLLVCCLLAAQLVQARREISEDIDLDEEVVGDVEVDEINNSEDEKAEIEVNADASTSSAERDNDADKDEDGEEEDFGGKYSVRDKHADHTDRAIKLMDQQKYKKALASFRAAVKHTPTRAEVWLNLGSYMANTPGVKKYNNAAKLVRKALTIAPDYADAKNMLKTVKALASGISPIGIAKQEAQADPENTEAWFAYAQALRGGEASAKTLSAIIKVYKTILKLDPEHEQTLHGLVEMDESGAGQAIPQSLKRFLKKGKKLKRKGKKGKAAAAATDGYGEDAEEEEDAEESGEDEEGEGGAAAGKQFGTPGRDGDELSTGYPPRDAKRAVARFKAALRDDPENADAWAGLGHAMRYAAPTEKNFDNAVKAFANALKFDPQNAIAKNGIRLRRQGFQEPGEEGEGEGEGEGGEEEEGEEKAQKKAAKPKKKKRNKRNKRAAGEDEDEDEDAQAEDDNKKQTSRMISRARGRVKKAPEDADAWAELGSALRGGEASDKNLKELVRCYRKALQLDPKQRVARSALKELKKMGYKE